MQWLVDLIGLFRAALTGRGRGTLPDTGRTPRDSQASLHNRGLLDFAHCALELDSYRSTPFAPRCAHCLIVSIFALLLSSQSDSGCRIYQSIAVLKAAKPPAPKAMACGPAFLAKIAPAIAPAPALL